MEYKRTDAAEYSLLTTLTAGTDFSSAAMGAEQNAYYSWDTTALSGNYNIRVRAEDYSGNKSDYMEVIYRLDKTPPAVPANVAAAGASGRLTVTWDAVDDSAGDLWGYYIYRQVQDDPLPAYTYMGSINKASARSFNDYNLVEGKEYKYAVSSRDDLGNESQKGEA